MKFVTGQKVSYNCSISYRKTPLSLMSKEIKITYERNLKQVKRLFSIAQTPTARHHCQ